MDTKFAPATFTAPYTVFMLRSEKTDDLATALEKVAEGGGGVSDAEGRRVAFGRPDARRKLKTLKALAALESVAAAL